jgi:hypothetical protein
LLSRKFSVTQKTNPLCDFEKRQTQINKGGMAAEKKREFFGRNLHHSWNFISQNPV